MGTTLRNWLGAWLLWWCGALPLLAQGVLPVPPLSGHVIDQTASLSTAQASALEAKLSAFEASSGTQFVVLLVPTTQPEDIASYANRVGNTWEIGRKDIGDGLLLVVAIQDRSVRFEVAKTLEGAIPDLAAKRIIDEAITPRFREADIAGGLNAGVEQAMALVRGEPLPEPDKAASSRDRPTLASTQDLLFFMVFALPMAATVARTILGRGLGSLAAAGVAGTLAWLFSAGLLVVVAAALIAGGLALFGSARTRRRGGTGFTIGGAGGWAAGSGLGGGGGWSGGSGGGGGFSSGGGGDFGGGGASGRW